MSPYPLPSPRAPLPAAAAPAVPGAGREDSAGTRLARSRGTWGAGVGANFSLCLGLLALLLPRQRQYDLWKLFLFPSGSSSAVCVGKINCLIIARISNHVTFSVALR